MILHLKEIKSALKGSQVQSRSMRRRLIIYLTSIMLFFALLLFMLLFLFGLIDPITDKIEQALTNQLENSTDKIEQQSNDQAAYAVVMSRGLTTAIREDLTAAGITFEELRNNADALTSIQHSLYDVVYDSMQRVPCSGAFCILNTTVNDTLPTKSYQCVYLKYANLYAENTLQNDVCLFRGSASLARENNINLYSTWQLETQEGAFPEVDALMSEDCGRISESYLLTSVYQLPDSWETVRLLCIPVVDAQGATIGVCGFEISSLYFKLAYKAPEAEQSHIFCALLDRGPNDYAGQVSGNRSGYFPSMNSAFTVEHDRSWTTFRSKEEDIEFVGKMQEVALGKSNHVVSVMLPAEDYQAFVKTAQLKIAAILFATAVLILAVALWGSKKYVAPILEDLERIKGGASAERERSNVLEIGDLFDFLAQQDQKHEATLAALHQEKLEIKSRLDRLQNELKQVNQEYESAQEEISRLSYSRKQEIDPDDFQFFLDGINNFTPAEHRVFALYLDGKSAKEIIETLGITKNTLKYHNKNIYNKLGVSSRKQLLRYATLMKKQEEDAMN